MYFFCTLIDKGVTSSSSTIEESESKGFLIKTFEIIGNEKKAILLKRKLGMEKMFLEKNWAYECPVIGLNKVPRQVGGYNIIIPVNPDEIKDFNQLDFYLVNDRDTIKLRGLNAVSNEIYKKGFFQNYQLIIKNNKSSNKFYYKLLSE